MLSLIGTDRHHFNSARELVDASNFDLNMVLGQQLAHPIRPFDDTDTISFEVLLQPKIDNIFQSLKPIEVDMVNWDFSVVLVDEDVGRAIDSLVLTDTGTAGDALCQTGFPSAQIADECNNITGVKLASNCHTDFLCFFGAMRPKDSLLVPYR